MRFKFILIFATLLLINGCQKTEETTDIIPQRIVLNISESPTTSIGLTWMTRDAVSLSQVQIAEATVWTQFLDSLKTYDATSSEFITDKKEQIFNHALLLKNLLPDTKYVYRVGGDSIWSEWIQFKTAKIENEPFEFTFFGDPQNNNKDHVSRVFRQAFKHSPNSEFWLFSGDIISEPEDTQISEFFFAGNPFFSFVPLALAPGNHDRAYETENGEIVRNEKGKKQRLDVIDKYWNSSFTLPENGLPGFEETSYYFDYQGVRIIMINSNNEDMLDEQAVWLDEVLQNNKNNWSIVSFHHPIYSAGRERDDDETRDIFMPVFDKHNVDLVLTGHDHAYARSYKLKNGKRVNINELGTVYVVSVSGPKMYSVNSIYNDIMAKTGGEVQLFQVIRFENNKMIYNAYTASGELYDSFELNK